MYRLKSVILAIILLSIMSLGFRFSSLENKSLTNIYLYDNYLLVSDENEGVHIYSVVDAANPQYITTIALPGNSGAAMRDDIIYANQWDAIASFRLHPDGSLDTLAIIHGELYGDWDGRFLGDDVIGGSEGCMGCRKVAYDNAQIAAPGGTGGSYATFAIIDTFLYHVDDQNIVTLSIADPDSLLELSRTYIDWSIETLFPTEEYLFIGGTRGMYIMDRADPAHPTMISSLEHFKACDPVVVEDTVAYVTLRGGNACGETRDLLLSVTIKDPRNPRLLDEINIHPPYGLAASDTLLYVSLGVRGFDLYTIHDPGQLKKIESWDGPETKDFIWAGTLLYIMSFDNIRIFDVSNPLEPRELSVIE
jgi:hypothetical protein